MIFDELIIENKNEFIAKEKKVARYLWVLQEHLRFLMWFETGHTLDHRIQNRTTHAIGLIQFMPSTAIALGTSIDALKAMSNVEQLNYVQKFLSPFRTEFQDFVDLYCGIFWPAAVGKPDSFIITPQIVAKQNPLFDIDKDGDIEKSEIRTALLKHIPVEFRQYFTN